MKEWIAKLEMEPTDKKFAVKFIVGGDVQHEEMILHSPSKSEARKYCIEWATFAIGTKVWKIREVKL